MTIAIDLPVELGTRLEEEAARLGQRPDEYVRELVRRELVLRELAALRERKPPQTLADLKPRAATPPGMNWLESIRGEWPGNESDEEIYRALEEMS